MALDHCLDVADLRPIDNRIFQNANALNLDLDAVARLHETGGVRA